MPRADFSRVKEKMQSLLSHKYDRKVIREAPELRAGESHSSISEVQSYLKHYGYLNPETPSTEGRLDAPTVNALEHFQRRFKVEATGNLDAPTRSAMAAARCGVPDVIDPLAFTTIGAWSRRDLTFAFGNLSTQIGSDVCADAVRRALDTWLAAGVGLLFTQVQPDENPDILIEWRVAADPDHTMVGGVLAHADFPPGFSVIVNSLPLPLHFDDEEHTWVDGLAASSYDIETVALHEIGHCLGLLHSDIPGSVMFPTVSANHTLRALQADDLSGIANLYP